MTNQGKIHAWWPFLATYHSTITPETELDGPLPGDDEDSFQPYSESSIIPVKRGTVGPEVPFELPPIPTLTETDVFGSDEQQWSDRLLDSNHPTIEDPLFVVAVGAGDGFCAALRANGELWVFELRENEAPSSKSWRYVGHGLTAFCKRAMANAIHTLLSCPSCQDPISATYQRRLTASLLTPLPRHLA